MPCTVTAYQLNDFEDNDSWENAFAFVEANYGDNAICCNIFELDATHESVVNRLVTATTAKDVFFDFLFEEIDRGATHVFVHPLPKSTPIFGLKLSQLK